MFSGGGQIIQGLKLKLVVSGSLLGRQGAFHRRSVAGPSNVDSSSANIVSWLAYPLQSPERKYVGRSGIRKFTHRTQGFLWRLPSKCMRQPTAQVSCFGNSLYMIHASPSIALNSTAEAMYMIHIQIQYP